MIPHFPRFAKLKLEHKSSIEKITSKFSPYSDYNFASLWSYNTDNSIEVSILNNNLVVKFTDYLTVRPFYSFIGKNKIKQTVKELLTFAKEKKVDLHLKLIPEAIIQADPSIYNHFTIVEDRDNHDYIISAKHVSELPIDIFKRKNYLVERFKRKYPQYKVKLIDLTNKINQQEILDLFAQWEKIGNKDRKETENELEAIKRLINSIHQIMFYTLGIYDGTKLIAFNMYEKTFNNHGISAFQKADKTYTGIYAMLSHEAAKHLRSLGCTHINYEQDLGIEGLRLSKSLWKPTHFLKKYIIKPKK